MKFKYLSIIFLSAVLVGCGPIEMPPVSYYQLGTLKQAKAPKHAKTRLTILVSTPTASSGYQSSSMIYMLTPYELRSYANSQWVAPPGQMLLPMFVQALRQTGHFFAVVSAPFAGMTNYRLDTQLLKLQQEFFLPVSRIRLAVQASLIKGTTNQVIATRLFEVVIPAPSNNPYGGVLSANKAAAIVSHRIAQFCATYARGEKVMRGK